VEWVYTIISISIMVTVLFGGSLYFHYKNIEVLKKTIIIVIVILIILMIIQYFVNKI